MCVPCCVRQSCRQRLIDRMCAWCQGMRKGVKESAAFILFLSAGVLLRPVRASSAAEAMSATSWCPIRSSSLTFVVAVMVVLSQFCQLEIREALALKKPVVLLHGESGTVAAKTV